MIIHTPGGILFSAYQIAKALKEHKGKVTVFIPHYAMSGGTLIALGADKIVMDKDAILGPVDPQLVQGKNAMSAVALEEIPQFKKWDKIDDSTVVLIDQAKKVPSAGQTHGQVSSRRSHKSEGSEKDTGPARGRACDARLSNITR